MHISMKEKATTQRMEETMDSDMRLGKKQTAMPGEGAADQKRKRRTQDCRRSLPWSLLSVDLYQDSRSQQLQETAAVRT